MSFLCSPTPTSQTFLMGLVFFFTFTAYLTIQAFAADMYGDTLGSNMATSLYLAFAIACFGAPSFVNKAGSKNTMFLGVLGYAALVGASLIYFLEMAGDWIVILGGVACGIGAALLWTAQGRLIMQYSDGTDNGYLFSIFWALFNLSALVGGLLTFFYFGSNSSSGNVALYVIFLVFVVLGALATQLLVPPSQLIRGKDESNLALLPHAGSNGTPDAPLELSQSDWFTEMKATLSLFKTRRMLYLSLIFFYTGYNQPYQLNTFGNRWFTKKTIGLEMIIFYTSEIVGGLYIGAMLDGASGDKGKQRTAAKKCLVIFFLVTLLSFGLCTYVEWDCAFVGAVDGVDCVVPIEYNDKAVVLPSVVYALWGFSDSQIQTYAYWLMGTLYAEGATQARAVGFYKCVQSLGWTVGFALVPSARMEPMLQMAATAACFLVGTGLAVFELPVINRRSSSRGSRGSRKTSKETV